MKVLLLVVLAAAFCFAAGVPLLNADNPDKIEGRYILVFKDEITDDIANDHLQNLSKSWNPNTNAIRSTFHIGAFRGFSAEMDLRTLASELQSPHLKYVESDEKVVMYPYEGCDCTLLPSGVWGPDRVSYRLEKQENSLQLLAPDTAGAGVNIYVIDTGIWITHNDFGGRAKEGVNTVGGTSSIDDNGHGTHVASIAAGTVYGIAKGANLIAVKVLTGAGSGSADSVIQGINWAANNAKSKSTASVANLSLGGGFSQAINDAADNAVKGGLPLIVAAGNDNSNACTYSPASAQHVFTVGATDPSDFRASFSNFGTCVNIFAPGVSILAAYRGNNGATRSLSGTSMASPAVAGVAALYLEANPNVTPAQLASHLTSSATQLEVSGNFGSGSPKILAYIDCDESSAKTC